ncbi:FdhF/YdeP family oxidoreductase [Leptolyngbya sp. AN02str]|uniref:FdhF/YdeP family oxidoreductase n=1 Tax=Leptolyngbya sp. AN02str TaxID=3423363 RepID=UPI003D3173F8
MVTDPQSPNPDVPSAGGGLPVIQYWAEKTLSPQGPKIWQVLNHKSACLSCAWGTGGQKGGFMNEDGEILQRCMKSVEAIAAELMPPAQFHERYTLSELQQLSSMECDRLGRLSVPLVRRAGSDRYERISWEEALDLAAAAFREKRPHEIASYSSGRSSNEAAFLLQLMIRALGSNNLADCSDLCHAPSTVGLKHMFGSGTSMVSLDSLKHADCVVLIGSNAPANHPRLMNELIQLRDRGGKVIIINPMIEVGLVKFGSPAFPIKSLLSGGSDISSMYLQPIPGSDVAVFVGLQKSLIEQNLVPWEYLTAHTDGWEAVVQHAKNISWDAITTTCGLSKEELDFTARTIGQANGTVFAWAMGVTQQANGVDNIWAIANTALLTGNCGKLGGGTMPIRGHSNVQGFGSMGVAAQLQDTLRESLETLLKRPLNREPGYDTRALIEAAEAGTVRTLLCLGGNLYAANPDLRQAKRALGNIDTVVYLATKPNLGHFHGLACQNTLLLPVYNRFENPHKTTAESGNNFVRLNDEGKTHLEDADLMAEVTFLGELAYRIHGDRPIDWRNLQDPRYVRQLIGQTIPGYEKMSAIDATQQEFTISGRILTSPTFGTPNGKAQMMPTPLPDLSMPTPQELGISDSVQGIMLALGTGRSYSQHNTVVYRDGDKYRGMPHRNCIVMNPVDAKQGGFRAGDRVTVQGNAGQLDQVEVVYGAIRQGAAMMFYPEVNAIFAAPVDPRCGTPAFKRVPVMVYTKP